MSKIDFTDADVHRNLTRISVPMMFLSILDYLAIFINLGWLALLASESGLPVVFRLAGSIIAILEAAFSGILGALYVYANQYFGRKDYRTTRHLVGLGIGVSIMIGLAIAVTGRLVSAGMLTGFGVDEDVKFKALRYLDTYWYGYAIVLLHVYAGLIAKMSGDMKVTVRFRIITFCTNLVASPLLILLALHHGHDPLQAAALSLIGSRLIGLLVLGRRLLQGQVFPFRISVAFLPARWFGEWPALNRLAGAETLNNLSLTLSFFLFALILSHYEPGALAAITIGQYATGFFQTVLLGVIASLIPFTSQNAGTRNLRNIGLGVRWMTLRVFAVCFVVAVPCMLLAPWVIGLFVDQPEVAAKAAVYIQITMIPWAFLIASFPYIFAIVGLGDTRGTLVLTIWSMYLGNLAPLLLVLHVFGDSLVLAAIAESCAHVFTFGGCALYYRWKERQLSATWTTAAGPEAAVPPAGVAAAAT